jgi:pimeloyl-ACP methyl ester carboxylesterase
MSTVSSKAQVTSKDGTELTFDRQGDGPPVVLVGGGFVDRSENAPLATELAGRFTTYNYDRRGRGESGDTLPYAVEREIEDVEALIAEAGGPVHLYGASSGGALALEAAAAGLTIERLAVYEVPYAIGEEATRRWQEYVGQLGAALADGRRGDAAELFMRVAGAPEESIAGARSSEYWPGLKEIAPTLAYDAAILGDGPPPTARLAKVTQPTLVATGAVIDPHMGNAPVGFFDDAADAIAESVPRAEHQVLEGQTHEVDSKAIAPLLERFFSA